MTADSAKPSPLHLCTCGHERQQHSDVDPNDYHQPAGARHSCWAGPDDCPCLVFTRADGVTALEEQVWELREAARATLREATHRAEIEFADGILIACDDYERAKAAASSEMDGPDSKPRSK